MKQLNDLSNAELNTLHKKLEKDSTQAHVTDRIKWSALCDMLNVVQREINNRVCCASQDLNRVYGVEIIKAN
jgi:hypothetical protein